MDTILSGFGAVSKNTSDTVYLGNFIVREDMRGKGIGRQIWDAMIKKAGDMNIALDSEPYMVEWYKKRGFKYSSFKVTFYNVAISEEMKKGHQPSCECRDLTDDLWPMVVKYDRQVYPTIDRERILRAWFGVDGCRAVVALRGNEVVGYGSIHKKPNQQYGLRNVFANDETVIETLLMDLFNDIPEGYVVRFMKVDDKPMPKCIEHSVDMADSALRMYNKFLIETKTDKMWFTSAHIL